MTCELNGPWYTFDKIERKTGRVKNELLFNIESHNIPAVLHSTNRPFLAVSRTSTGKLIAHATFRYSGPLAVPQHVFHALIRDEQTLLKAELVKPLQFKNLDEWFLQCPYRGQCPNGIFDAWEPKSYDELKDSEWFAIIFPEEVENYEWAETTLVDMIPEHYEEEYFFDRFAKEIIIESPSSPFYYSTHEHGDYYLSSIRFPQLAVDVLLNKKSTITQKPPREKYLVQHESPLYHIIARAIDENPGVRSNILWQKILHDTEKEFRLYDPDDVIERMDDLCIEWVHNNGLLKVYKRISFRSTVLKIKKLMNHKKKISVQ